MEPKHNINSKHEKVGDPPRSMPKNCNIGRAACCASQNKISQCVLCIICITVNIQSVARGVQFHFLSRTYSHLWHAGIKKEKPIWPFASIHMHANGCAPYFVCIHFDCTAFEIGMVWFGFSVQCALLDGNHG